jgi:hypothetical protein
LYFLLPLLVLLGFLLPMGFLLPLLIIVVQFYLLHLYALLMTRWLSCLLIFAFDDQVSKETLHYCLLYSIANPLFTINVVQLLSGLHEALEDSSAMTELTAANVEKTNGWYKFVAIKHNVTTGFARGYAPLTGLRVVSRTKQWYDNTFSVAIFSESIKRATSDAVSSEAFLKCYNQAASYRSMVDLAKENRQQEKQKADDRQAQMNKVELGYGLQPHGTERSEAPINHRNDLSRLVAVVSPPVVAPPAAATAGVPTQAAAGNAIITPKPRHVNKIGDLEANAKSLDELVRSITHFTSPTAARTSTA